MVLRDSESAFSVQVEKMNRKPSQLDDQASGTSNQSSNLPTTPLVLPVDVKFQISQLQEDLQSCCGSQLEEKFRLIQNRLLLLLFFLMLQLVFLMMIRLL